MQTVDLRHFPIEDGDRVLDLGCGEGRHTLAASLAGDVTVVGVDLSLADLQATRGKLAEFSGDVRGRPELLSANAGSLPFADDSFDKVICSEVLEHLHDYERALGEIERVLRPGGLFCASVPRAWPERICWWLSEGYRSMEGGHVRIFNARQLREQVEALGLQCYRRDWAHALHSPFWWLKCLFWERREGHPAIRAYHRLLVWDLVKRPLFTRGLERLLDPVMGKSVVLYFRKGALS